MKDRKVREAWNLASFRHEQCVEDFEIVKLKIRKEGLAMG
jgi:hypothetical protein